MSTASSQDDLQPRTFSRPTWADIDLDALRSNVRALHQQARVPLLGVVKANAYGHGAVAVARTLLDEEAVTMLAVASVDEGLRLREAGLNAPLLLLSAMLPDEANAAVQLDLTPTVFTLEVARAVSQAAGEARRIAPIHFKIDTGMTRLGVWHEDAAALLRAVLALPNLRVEAIYTHLACADEEDDTFSATQLQAFGRALIACHAVLREYSAPPIFVHAANSAATLRYGSARFDRVRPGLALYGVSPLPLNQPAPELRPVMSLRSRVTHVRDVAPGTAVSYGATWRASQPSCLATVPVGYADGYARRLSNRAQVLVRGRRCPVVGRVTMDQIIVDCSPLKPRAQIGEPVMLWGEGLPVEEVARWAETIPYELLCAVSRRVPRVYRSVRAPESHAI
jgi:alanine racemase